MATTRVPSCSQQDTTSNIERQTNKESQEIAKRYSLAFLFRNVLLTTGLLTLVVVQDGLAHAH